MTANERSFKMLAALHTKTKHEKMQKYSFRVDLFPMLSSYKAYKDSGDANIYCSRRKRDTMQIILI